MENSVTEVSGSVASSVSVSPRAVTPPAQGGAGATRRSGSVVDATLGVRPGEEPWHPEELDDLQAELVADLTRLKDDVRAMQANLATVMRDNSDGAGDDQADTGSKAFEREQELTLLASTRETLYQSQHALARIADGTYGVCENCGGPIGKLRLQAFPRATQCVACKQRQERR